MNPLVFIAGLLIEVMWPAPQPPEKVVKGYRVRTTKPDVKKFKSVTTVEQVSITEEEDDCEYGNDMNGC